MGRGVAIRVLRALSRPRESDAPRRRRQHGRARAVARRVSRGGGRGGLPAVRRPRRSRAARRPGDAPGERRRGDALERCLRLPRRRALEAEPERRRRHGGRLPRARRNACRRRDHDSGRADRRRRRRPRGRRVLHPGDPPAQRDRPGGRARAPRDPRRRGASRRRGAARPSRHGDRLGADSRARPGDRRPRRAHRSGLSAARARQGGEHRLRAGLLGYPPALLGEPVRRRVGLRRRDERLPPEAEVGGPRPAALARPRRAAGRRARVPARPERPRRCRRGARARTRAGGSAAAHTPARTGGGARVGGASVVRPAYAPQLLPPRRDLRDRPRGRRPRARARDRRARGRGRLGDAHHPPREHEPDDRRDRGASRRDDLTAVVHHRAVTYSIVARDPTIGELGVAVQSRSFNTGAACAWAEAGVGAVATQSFTERRYGPRGLALLAEGREPREALDELLAADESRAIRQVAFVDVHGATAAHTGTSCIPHAGDLAAEDVSVQGNMLRSADVWPAMREAFDATTGTLAGRLLAALDGAEAAGGDYRGRQAAGLVVVSGEPDEQPSVDRVFDLRVDDHEEPLRELRRLHRLAAGHRRRNRIDETADPDEEREAALEAGLRPDEAALAALFAHARRGETDEAVALVGELVDAEPMSMEAFERYEALGLLPTGLLDRARAR